MRFDEYFDQRSRRFAAFYRSPPVTRLLGRGALLDRLAFAVDTCIAVGAERVLDIGCGSGPLFEPLSARGIEVTGIEPAPHMVALANEAAQRCNGLAHVVKIGWEDLVDWHTGPPYDVAVALGVFDYVANPQELFNAMAAVARHSVGSFPAPGMRTNLRKVRYGVRGVTISSYSKARIERLASRAGMATVQLVPLGRAGHALHARVEPGRTDQSVGDSGPTTAT